MTVSTKFAEVTPPLPSFAVTVTVYGPPTEASLAKVPEITPVFASMLTPAGRPLAEKVRVSPSTSENAVPVL